VTPWRIEVERAAQKALDALPGQDRKALIARLGRLSRGEQPVDLRKLQGRDDLYRVRSGRWRAVVSFNPTHHVITLLDVDDRKDIYR
jgi:mRNA-degrading endonuclease RelE of RelBE toxin-antitoxin system